MKVIDGQDAVLGRLASFAAKEALKGEEIAIVNCEEINISGNKTMIEADFKEKRERRGHSKRDPKHPRTSEKIVKRAIRGMLPDYRLGRGKEAFKRIKCYKGLPKEFEESKKIEMANKNLIKKSKVKEFAK
jgi:large subunit ribosomal protein L13